MENIILDDLTLAECQKYLAEDPHRKNAQKILERMEFLLQEAVWKKDKFNIEFHRYFATQRYEEAFTLCLNYLHETDDRTTVLEKTNLVIPKLKNRIQIPLFIPVTYDWLIDQLVLRGYSNMTYGRTFLKWKMSCIKISAVGKATVITSNYRYRYLLCGMLQLREKNKQPRKLLRVIASFIVGSLMENK